MDDRSTDIFGPVEENSDDSEEEEEEVEPEEEQEKDQTRLVASSKRKEKLRKINQTMIRGAHYAKKWGRISKNSTGTKSSSSWIGENPKPMPIMPLSMPYITCMERKATKGLLRPSKMDSPY